jgi:hypothetical protein
MTDFAAEPSERRVPIYERHQNLILVAAGAIMALIAAGIIYSFGFSGGDSVMSQIKAEAQGQLVTQDVSCHKLNFSVPTLTKQTIYACSAKNVAEPNRPIAHLHESAFTRCYVQAVNTQVVDVSRAISVEAKLRGKHVPCS